MFRKIVLSLLCTFILIPVCAQTWDEVKRHSDIYLFGEGWGATVEEADQQALAALISKISVVVSNDFTIIEDEKTKNGELDATTYTNSKLQTYSSATLTNTERIVIDTNPDESHIGRFIKRTELDRIFEGRRRTVREHVRLGMMAETKGKIDDALRNYYWAFALLKSLQQPAEFTYTDEETGKEIHPLTWLPERIGDIFDDLDVTMIANDGTNVDLMFTFQGKPVGSLDFTYFDGRNWSNIASVKNGRGTMEFNEGMVPENVQINYEYTYRGQAHINQEIKSVLAVVKGQAIKGARVNVRTSQVMTETNHVMEVSKTNHAMELKKTESSLSVSASSTSNSSSKALAPVNDEKPYREILSKVVNAIKKRAYDNVMSHFTKDGKEMFQQLVMYGNARVLNTNECILYQFGDNVVARSIQMSFSFKRGIKKNFVEDIVFTFNQDQQIDCVAFGLDAKAKEDIMTRGAWTEEARQAIMEFLENYKTAYALKRIDYLRSIFDDDAVIIVGHVAHRMERMPGDQNSFRDNKYIKRTQYSKEQYLKNLEACFRSNEFVNIRFANNDVRKAKDEEEYGIQIKQDYFSTNYGDEGYLYLQVDLNKRKEPVIKVRTWQPEPDPEVGLFGLGTF